MFVPELLPVKPALYPKNVLLEPVFPHKLPIPVLKLVYSPIFVLLLSNSTDPKNLCVVPAIKVLLILERATGPEGPEVNALLTYPIVAEPLSLLLIG